MNSLYLWINLLSLSVPLLFSFHPRIRLYHKWSALFPAIGGTLLPFVIWDSYFTHLGVWGFNPAYLLGIFYGGLPLEEILFFICIPYACLFTYYCFKIYYPADFKLKYEKRITFIILMLLAVGLTLHGTNYYTGWTFTALALALIFVQYLKPQPWLSLFYYSHMFLILPFLIVNGLLTGTGITDSVVWYNDLENMGIRILTIPVEDIFYGMLMLMINVSIFEYLIKKFRLTVHRL
ncbi:lycopene cyclase domain-containing protein [Dyadobacter jejuensis]|nr:lycopene cyclase domain-containing protein [Dyadobacter jejuensis]